MNTYLITYEWPADLCDCHSKQENKDFRFTSDETTAKEMFDMLSKNSGYWEFSKVIGDNTFEFIESNRT